MSMTIHQRGHESGPCIVFLHGAGVSHWMWEAQIEALASRYKCIAVDLPGSGESHGETWHSFADTAAQLAAMIRAEAPSGKAHVVGLSLGGYTALKLLEHDPEVVETMVVSGVTTRPFGRQWLWRLMLPLMCRMLRWDWVIRMQIKMMQLPPDVHALYRRDCKRMSPQMLPRIYEEILPYQLPEAWPEGTPPLLAVAGEREAALILESLPDFPKALPHSRAMIAPDAHHGWNGEYPELFTEMIDAWCQQKPLPDGLHPLALLSGASSITTTE